MMIVAAALAAAFLQYQGDKISREMLTDSRFKFYDYAFVRLHDRCTVSDGRVSCCIDTTDEELGLFYRANGMTPMGRKLMSGGWRCE